jgi:uncharacterized protein
MFTRNISALFEETLQDTPLLLVNGSRQVGKSTFVKILLEKTHAYYTLDDPTILSSALRDPLMFLESLPHPSIIDEIQRALPLFLPLKKLIDQNREPGFFVLTGSADVLSLPRLADSLAGRLEIYTLWPLSQGELEGKKEDFISFVFNASSFPIYQNTLTLEGLIERILRGGYPEIIKRSLPHRRRQWFTSYLQTLIEKDIKSLASIEGIFDLPNLIQICAARCGSLLNFSELSRVTRLPATTLNRYFALLQQTYLMVTLPPWTKNLNKRMVKAPKLYLNDTGLLTHILDYDRTRLLKDRSFLGHVLENFVVMEIKKQLGWSQQRCRLYHYRTHTQQEIDLILEAADSRLVAIEIKLSKSVTPKDFQAMQNLQTDVGSLFHRGIVFYMGESIVPFGPNLYAVPLPFLWDHP